MMLSVPINGQVQSRLIPPTFVEDNISDMFKAVDAGHNIVVTAVDSTVIEPVLPRRIM